MKDSPAEDVLSAIRNVITEIGVKKHLRLIFAKLGAANRSEAVAIALKKQLLKI